MNDKPSNERIRWEIDPAHSEIGFKVKHLMITTVKGSFTEYSADIQSDREDFSKPYINVKIKAASVTTHDQQRDGHLRSADFFDVENHPEIIFEGTSFKNLDEDGNYELKGDLAIRGIKKRVSLKVEYLGMMKDPWGNLKAGFTITGKVNRKDWGLNWNAALEAGGVLVSDDVSINCEVQLKRET